MQPFVEKMILPINRYSDMHASKCFATLFAILGILLLILNSCSTLRSGFNGNDYVVNKKIDLRGETLILPQGGVLRFGENGCLTNGTIKGNKTKIEGAKKGVFNGIHITGEWVIKKICSDYFKDSYKDDVLKELFALSSANVTNEIIIRPGEYWVTATADNKFALMLPGNTTLKNEGVIRLRGNNLISYAVLATSGHNVKIEGGTYHGERNLHQGTTGEWGHGIRITEGASSVTVKNVRVYDCWGDGVAIDGNKVNTDVLVEHFEISNCRRQGISVIFAKDCIIRNGIITNIQGTEPHLGIDIEPNSNGYCENVTIDNVIIESEKGIGVFTALKEFQTRQVTIRNCKVRTTGYAPFYASRCDGLILNGNEFTTTVEGQNHVIVINTAVKNCIIENNTIKHLSKDKQHYCIYSSGEKVRIIGNNIYSEAGVAFYTSNAVVENNHVDVPQLMIRVNNANGNVFRKNTILGGIQSIAPDNQFIENEVAGEVSVKGPRNIYKDNKEK